MEEKKAKEVTMKVAEKKDNTSNTKKEKMTYEELNDFANQVSQQNKQLYQRLQENNMFNMFKRVDYLFKVIENSIAFPQEFVDSCSKEIQKILTIPEDKKVDKD